MNLVKKVLIILSILLLMGIISYMIVRIVNIVNTKNNKININVQIEGRSAGENNIYGSSFDDAIEEDFNTNFTSHQNYQLFDQNRCGPLTTSPRLEGGNVAGYSEFPWLVAFFIKSEHNLTYFCGGSLISKNLVLTAAHCLVDLKGNGSVIVRLGEYNIQSNEDCDQAPCDPVQDFNSSDFSFVIHPRYDNKTAHNDIALVKLNRDANVTQKNINFVCLPFKEPEIAFKLTIIGFGLHEKSTTTMDNAKKMRVGVVNQIDGQQCMSAYGNAFQTRGLRKGQFCAARRNKNGIYVDTCKGDSGGPIMMLPERKIVKREVNDKEESAEYDYPDQSKEIIKEEDPLRYVQLGIVSFGEKKNCGEGKRPGIYTKVYPYLWWILDHSGSDYDATSSGIESTSFESTTSEVI